MVSILVYVTSLVMTNSQFQNGSIYLNLLLTIILGNSIFVILAVAAKTVIDS